ncbi:hypothetical protein DDJ45_10235 [Mycobacteroides abscessus]|nr:hypothetical protein DDJ45_10235 [Mycobacteroides abscessus]
MAIYQRTENWNSENLMKEHEQTIFNMSDAFSMLMKEFLLWICIAAQEDRVGTLLCRRRKYKNTCQ